MEEKTVKVKELKQKDVIEVWLADKANGIASQVSLRLGKKD